MRSRDTWWGAGVMAWRNTGAPEGTTSGYRNSTINYIKDKTYIFVDPKDVACSARSVDSWPWAHVRAPAPADARHGYRHEHAAAARMKGRRGLELGPHLARIEGVARGAREAQVLARDTGANPLTREVRVHIGSVGEHIEPLGKQAVFAEPVRLRLRRVGRRGSVQTLPPRWKDPRSGKGGLPAIEVGPRKIRSAGRGRHRSPFDQSRRTATRAHATGGPEMTSRPAAASDRMIGHEGSNSDRRKLNFADRGWA